MRSALSACVVLAAQAVLVATLAFGSPCPEGCPEDGADGRCLPLCTTCVCSPHQAPAPQSTPFCAPAARAVVVAAAAFRSPRAPEPADIFHVPKPPVA